MGRRTILEERLAALKKRAERLIMRDRYESLLFLSRGALPEYLAACLLGEMVVSYSRLSLFWVHQLIHFNPDT